MLKGKRLLFLFFLLISLFSVKAFSSVESVKTVKNRTDALNEQDQRKFDYFFYEALNLKHAGKFDAAYDLYIHCLSLDSTRASVLFELSSFYAQMNKPELVLKMLRKATQYSPENFTYQTTYASASLALGETDNAINEYNSLLAKYPNKSELNFYLAQALAQKGEFQKSIDAFNALEDAVGMNEMISMRKYALYSELNDSDKAFSEIEKLAAKFPDESRYLLILGDLHLSKNDTLKARSYYNRAYTIDPESPNYTVSMANYYEATGDKQAAEREIQQALINDKLDVDIKIGILSSYIQQLQHSQKELDGTNALFETLMTQHPEETRLKLIYAGLLTMQEKTDEARFQYQIVTEMEPGNQSAWQQYLNLSLKENKMEEVVEICKKCIELFPESPEYHFYLGIGYFQLKQYTEAISTYKEGIKIIPVENTRLISDFYGQIGDIFFQINEADTAYMYYEQALEYNENNVVVLNNYSYYLSLEKKDLQKAERMSGLTVKLEPDNSTYLDTYAWIFFMQGNYTFARIYIENAISKDKTESPELLDHYGDILYMIGEKDKALEQWKLAKEKGKESETLDKKIKEGKYIEEPAPSLKDKE